MFLPGIGHGQLNSIASQAGRVEHASHSVNSILTEERDAAVWHLEKTLLWNFVL